MADVNLDKDYVRMSWLRFAAIMIGVGYLAGQLYQIKARLDSAVQIRQMNKWQKDLKTMNPSINVPNIMDYDSAALHLDSKGVADAH